MIENRTRSWTWLARWYIFQPLHFSCTFFWFDSSFTVGRRSSAKLNKIRNRCGCNGTESLHLPIRTFGFDVTVAEEVVGSCAPRAVILQQRD